MILEATEALLAHREFRDLTVEDVMVTTGLTRTSFYRYFPDRIVLLQALRDRALLRYRRSVVAAIDAQAPEHWWNAVEAAIDAFVEMFRTERGFRVTGRPPAGEELEAVLKSAGAREGDEVELGDEVLEWS